MSEPISPRCAVEIALDRAVAAGFEREDGSKHERGITIRCGVCGTAVTVPVAPQRPGMVVRRLDAFVDTHRHPWQRRG